MPAPGEKIEISLEEELPLHGDHPRRVRVSRWVDVPAGDAAGREAVERATRELKEAMVRTLAALGEDRSEADRPDRPLSELLEMYRPKDLPLLDALLWEGEITAGEHQALARALPAQAAPVPSKVAPSTAKSAGRTSPAPAGPPRDIALLVKEFGLKDTRDVNRARYERVISFEEWRLLRALFEKPSAPAMPP